MKSATKSKETARRKPRKERWGSALPSRSEQQILKRQAILKEAGRSFRRLGFHNTSLDDVAEELSVAKPTLYSYFKNKQEVLYECMKLAMDLGDVSVNYAMKGQNGLEKLRLFLTHYITTITSESGACAVFSDLHALEPEQMTDILARRDHFDRIFRRFITEGIEDGSIINIDDRLAVNCFMGAVNWIPAWFSDTGKRSPQQIADAFTQIFMTGLSAL